MKSAHLRLALLQFPNAHKSLGSALKALIETPSKRQRANMKRGCKPSNAVLLRQNRKQNPYGGGDVSICLRKLPS